jgi:hypothetical protein
MTYEIKPLSCDPKKLKGLSERLIVSHWENNYSGVVRRLNAISAQLATLDFGSTPVFVLNGLKREELIATNSMILHELYFEGLGAAVQHGVAHRAPWASDAGAGARGRPGAGGVTMLGRLARESEGRSGSQLRLDEGAATSVSPQIAAWRHNANPLTIMFESRSVFRKSGAVH